MKRFQYRQKSTVEAPHSDPVQSGFAAHRSMLTALVRARLTLRPQYARPALQSARSICSPATPVGPDPNDLSNLGAVLSGSLPAKYTAHGAARDAGTLPPLVVFCGWMGAKPSQMDKYLSLWHERGADTLSFAVGPMHVLFPSRGMAVMDAVTMAVRDDIERAGKRPIIFHHMSVGGYLFGQWLRTLERDGRSSANDPLLQSVTAQIFDSPPDVNGIANGAARSMGVGGIREVVFTQALRLYLALTRDTAGVHHRAASDAFHANSVRAPALWFFSRADEVSRHQDCERVAGLWRSSGIDVTQVVWDNTPHIQHFRVDPERYVAELDRFLERTGALALVRRAGSEH